MRSSRVPLLLLPMLGRAVMAQSNIDPAHKFTWGENLGWINWRDANSATQGAHVGATFLSGFIWTENVGWIHLGDGAPGTLCGGRPCYANFDDSDFGANIDPLTGELFGFAWGENIGWVNFDTASAGDDRAAFDACTHQFFGYVWGENVGWINLGEVDVFVGLGPCALGDIDCDGDVALDDYDLFQALLGGPGTSADCPAFDADSDGDLDLFDFAKLQAGFNGA